MEEILSKQEVLEFLVWIEDNYIDIAEDSYILQEEFFNDPPYLEDRIKTREQLLDQYLTNIR